MLGQSKRFVNHANMRLAKNMLWVALVVNAACLLGMDKFMNVFIGTRA